MTNKFILSTDEIGRLQDHPDKPVVGRATGNNGFVAKIIIPDYQKQIKQHYEKIEHPNHGEFKFSQFGLKVAFNKAIELSAYNEDWVLEPDLKELIKTFGVIIFENAYFSEKQRKDGQKNIFPSLAFHVDRGKNFDNQYSLFVRDPFDSEQKYPRSSGTLILSNQVARLQGLKEDKADMDMGARYDFFKNEPVGDYMNRIMVHQAWQAPENIGEICIFDNRKVLHASYYEQSKAGYKIGVRYLF